MKRYTEEQIEWLLENYSDKSKEEILKYFNYERSWQSICSICSKYKKRRTNDYYTKKDIDWLQDNYPNKPREEILKHFDNKRSWSSIQKVCSNNQINRSTEIVKAEITEEQINWLKNNFYSKPKKQILEYFNNELSWYIIKHICEKYGIKRKSKRHYTDEQIQWLKDNYYDKSKEDILNYFNNEETWQYIQSIASKFGISRKRNNARIQDPTDIVGSRFGRLFIKKYIGYKNTTNNRKDHYYLAACDCGNKDVEVGRHSITSGLRKSCGCLRTDSIERLKNFNGSHTKVGYKAKHINKLYAQYRRSAKNREYIFDLSKEEFSKLIEKPCYYCGSLPVNIHHDINYDTFLFNGIDRIDNNIGYTTSNVVTCCKWCNRAKSTRTINEFYGWINTVYAHINMKDEEYKQII